MAKTTKPPANDVVDTILTEPACLPAEECLDRGQEKHADHEGKRRRLRLLRRAAVEFRKRHKLAKGSSRIDPGAHSIGPVRCSSTGSQ